MDIQVKQNENLVVVSPKGRIDAITSPEFEAFVKEMIEKDQKHLVFNFGDLEYISSAGLRSILSIAKLLKTKDGKLAFAAVRDAVRNVFKISGFESIFTIYDSEEEAVRKLLG